MRHIPAFRLSPRLPYPQSLTIVRMHLDRKFFMREKELQKQGKPPLVARRLAHQLALILLAQLRQCFAGERPIGHLAFIPAQPRLANLFRKLMVRINRREIERPPGPGIKPRKHQQWIQVTHSNISPTKKTARKRNGPCRTLEDLSSVNPCDLCG